LLTQPLACLRALASSFCCSCSASVGIFLATGPACCRSLKCCGQTLSGGRFLFASIVVVSSDSLLHALEMMT